MCVCTRTLLRVCVYCTNANGRAMHDVCMYIYPCFCAHTPSHAHTHPPPPPHPHTHTPTHPHTHTPTHPHPPTHPHTPPHTRTACVRAGVPAVTSGGAGGLTGIHFTCFTGTKVQIVMLRGASTDPTAIRMCDLYECEGDPLAQKVRKVD
jgi:hypothetical protein